MRRACSSDVRSVSFLGRWLRAAGRSVPAARGYQPSRDRGRAGRSRPATAGGTRPSIGSSRRDRARGSRTRQTSTRRDREELDPVGRDSRETTPQSIDSAVGARPRRGAEPCELEHALGPRPRGERGELVGADQEDRIVEAKCLERVGCPCDTGRARPRRRRSRRTRARRDGASRLRRRVTPLCPGSATTRTSSRPSPKCAIAARRARRGRCAAGRRRRRGCRRAAHSQIDDLVADLDLGRGFTPAARSASSSSSPSGAVADDAEAAAGAENPEAAPRRGGCGR